MLQGSSRQPQDVSFSEDFAEAAISSSRMGSVEAMIRDRALAEREATRSPFSEREIRAVFSALLQGLAPPGM